MAKWLKIAAAPGTCCDCEKMTGPCDCIQLQCTFSCQSKAGIATLCGWSEYGTPSTPPKKYRKRDVQGTGGPKGILLHCEMQVPNCTTPDPTCPRSVSMTGSNAGATGNGYVQYVGTDGSGHTIYKVQSSAHLGDGTALNTRVSIGTGAAAVAVIYGPDEGTAYVPSTGNWPVSMEAQVDGFWYDLWSGCIDTGAPVTTIVQDTWQESAHYDKNTCAFSQDVMNDSRISGTMTACADPSGDPDAVTIPLTCIDPPTCYPTGVIVTTPAPYTRQTDGNGCTDHGDGTSTKWQGTIIEALSDEDLPKDAMARAEASIAWGGTDCQLYPAFMSLNDGSFTFGFRDVQVKATAGALPFTPLTIGHDYQITIGWYRRTAGSGGLWLFYGSDVITIHATHTSETTDWIDVPNDPGYETRPQSCEVVDVTPP